MRICLVFFSILVMSSIHVLGQTSANTMDEAAYLRTIHTRAEKIVATLGIADPSLAERTTNLIADQYRNLNTIYTERDAQFKIAKQKGEPKETTESEIKKIENSASEKIAALHTEFISSLGKHLSPDQVTKVKDGMTYNVVSVTYNAYVDMIPSLKKEEKEQIMVWLVEAREKAMDAESSEKKHAWFGKYKGRINNYLSAQGYNITEEREAWEKRKSNKQSGT